MTDMAFLPVRIGGILGLLRGEFKVPAPATSTCGTTGIG
jgi:hypothetical protein